MAAVKPTTASRDARAQLKRHCNRGVTGHAAPVVQNELLAIAHWMAKHDYDADLYGTGRLVEDFEHKIARLLGKPAAVFMPSGKMASLIALRIWAERSHNPDFGMHRSAHQELHEAHAYKELHRLRGHFLGGDREPIRADDYRYCERPLSTVVIELPMRELGGVLPPWEELVALRSIAVSRATRLHLDGARLWEAAAGYPGKTHAEIAALFDSVYVSFYKGIGGLSGAMLLGEEQFIEQARVWLVRHGGTLHQQYPAVASAAMRFDERLARMPAYYARTLAFAAALKALPGVVVNPDPPRVNLLHASFPVPPVKWEAARDHLAARDRIWLGAPRSGPGAKPDPSRTEIEIYVGDGLMELSDAEAVGAYRSLLEMAAASGGHR
jgi:threonine aldolase